MARWTLADYERLTGIKLPVLPEQLGSQRVGGRYVQVRRAKPIGAHGEKMDSLWEANYSYFLAFMHLGYVYEAREFIFHKIKTGVRVFTPDFYIPSLDEYREVKGYWDRRSLTKIKRMRIHYPTIMLRCVDKTFFKEICVQRLCKVISGWVCPHTAGTLETKG